MKTQFNEFTNYPFDCPIFEYKFEILQFDKIFEHTNNAGEFLYEEVITYRFDFYE